MPTFQEDLDFLKNHTEIHVLTDGKGHEAAVAPQLQGRVFTSTLGGSKGMSYGWINRELVASGKSMPHFSAYGGEDRFWLGPEGGQYALFFAPGTPFDLEHSYVPAPFDKEPFEVVEKENRRIRLRKVMSLPNYAGFTFQAELDRRIHLIGDDRIYSDLGLEMPGLSAVGFESVNRLKNTGKEAWKREKGLVSIWILGMFQPSPHSRVVIPFQEGPENELGPIVNDSYFGKVPGDRIKVGKNAVYFSGDGLCRSKIGLSPKRAKAVLGSWDSKNGVLTAVRYALPHPPRDYVNSMWEIQKDPYGGDVVNSYNDGPPEPGKKPEGPFYELETSSPAGALAPGETLEHVHKTFHFTGERPALDRAAKQMFGTGLDEIEKALPAK